METAKDITPPNRDKELWSAASIILELFNAQQEYTEQDWHDWLKEFTEKREKEIADKAWEAGNKYGYNSGRGYEDIEDDIDKSTFMKELFPESKTPSSET